MNVVWTLYKVEWNAYSEQGDDTETQLYGRELILFPQRLCGIILCVRLHVVFCKSSEKNFDLSISGANA